MRFTHFTRQCAKFLGSPRAFLGAIIVFALWLTTGPFLQFSTTWQLLVNTSTTIFTFFCMFILQSSQEHGDRALHIKLDELILKIEGADNKYVHAELAEEELVEELDQLHVDQIKR